MVKPVALECCESGAGILAVDQLAALCGGIPLVDLGCDLTAVLSQARFLLMQHRDRALNKLADRLIWSALNILLDQICKLRSKVNLHNRLFYRRSQGVASSKTQGSAGAVPLPGTFEEPIAPVYVDGRLFTTLKDDHIVAEFIKILDEYVESHYAAREEVAAQ